MITKIERLERSARDLHNLVHDLEQRHFGLLVLDQSIDTSTPHGRAFLGMLATKQIFEKSDSLKALREQGLTKPAIAEQVGISVASVYNVLSLSTNDGQ